MADNQDITLKILVLDAQGQFRGGTVDVEFRHRTLSEHSTQRGLDASREINIAGLRRAPTGDYKITVTPTDVFEQKSQFVNIPASSFVTMEVTFDHARVPVPPPDPDFVVKGAVRTAAGAPFTNGVLRAIHQTASGPVSLGEGKTDDQGSYVIKYSSKLVSGAITLRVQMFDENAKLIAQSDPITPAKHEEVVNLTLPPPEPVATPNRVEGKVSRPDGTMVVDAVVQAFDASMDSEQFLGKAVTDAFGHFKINYLGKPFEARGGADLIVRVFDAQGSVLATSAVIRKAKPVEQVSLVIDDNRPVKKPFVIRGTVREVNGKLAAGVIVRAFDRDLRSEELLGETKADAKGNYEIRYSPEQFRRAEKGSADLRVAAFDDKEQQLVSSPIIFNAQPEEIVDLSIGGDYRGPSEYENLLAQLTPVLQDVILDQLTEDDRHQDITFLANETGQDPQRITFLVLAHRLSRKTGLAAEAFYGFFREGLPTSLPALLAQSQDLLRRALVVAVDKNIIPAAFSTKVDAILEGLKRSLVQHAFEPVDGNRSSLGALLATTLLNINQQESFLTAYVNHSGLIEEFWHGLQDSPELKDHIEDIQFTLQLGALTSNHLPLVDELKRRQKAGEIADLSDLTRFDENDWQVIIAGQRGQSIGVPSDVPGNNAHERVLNYARAMSNMVEDAFPTAFITRRLETDDLVGRVDLVSFLRANPGFNLKTVTVDTYLKDNPDAFGTITDIDGTKSRIKAMQRVYKLAPRYSHTSLLMKDGHHSAYTICRVGVNAFIASYGDAFGAAHARDIHEKAHQTHAVALNLLVSFGPMIGRVGTRAVPDQQVISTQVTEEQSVPSGGVETRATSDNANGSIPDWSTLFGSLDLCDCDQCQSVHSPAAYLVDALHFLKDRRSKNEDTVKEILLGRLALPGRPALPGRRPDLGEIELTCENTNTPLPYVDLVNEVLEDAVAPPPPFAPFDLSSGSGNDLDGRVISANLTRDFSNNNVPLSVSATINLKRKGEWWAIDDLAFTYTVHTQAGGALRVTTRSRQTSGTARERAANPQYVNKMAYDKLREVVFPWTLPLDLWSEETRAFLAHLGVQRHQIMETFRTDDRQTILSNLDLACEYLGLTSREAEIITGETSGWPRAPLPELWNLWGFGTTEGGSIPDPADRNQRITFDTWLNVLRGRVDVFLQQSGLTYREMLDLLDTHYINPVGGSRRAIQIVSTDPKNPDTCETRSLILDGFDESAARRIVCFIRLWRKLGWTMRDLDRAVTVFSPPELDDRFIIKLSHVERLRRELGLPVIILLSWWGLIDTALYTDHGTSAQPRVSSLYAQLFRNRGVTNPLDADFPDEASELINPTSPRKNLSVHIATITAALGISAADFALLFNDGNIIPTVPDPADPQPIVENKRRIPDDWLNLDYLSKLFRHTTLARSLRLSVADYLIALRLIDANPFAHTIDTVMFVEKVGKARDAGFSLAELNYLLRHEFTRSCGLAPEDNAVAALLDEIRSGLKKIAAENTFSVDASVPGGATTDPTGELTRQKLALLNWSSPLIETVVATLNDSVTYETESASLPTNYEVDLTTSTTASSIPVELGAVVTYDAISHKLRASRPLTQSECALLRAAHALDPNFVTAINTLERYQGERQAIKYDAGASKLRFTGVMPRALRDRLQDSSPDLPYKAAIEALFNAPRLFVERAMRTFSIHNFATDLVRLARTTKPFPKVLAGRVYFDITTEPHKLHFVGPMLEEERDALLALALSTIAPYDCTDIPYQEAVRTLFAQPNDLTPDFITATDTAVFDQTPEARFETVLKKLLPYLRRTLSERLVAQKIAGALGLESKAAELLLTRWVASPTDLSRTRRFVADFLDSTFAESNHNVRLVPESFPAQFKAFALLHKIAAIATKLKINARQFAWLFEYLPSAERMDLNALPTGLEDPAPSFDSWLRLVDLFQLRDSLPAGEIALDEVWKTRVPAVSQPDFLKLLCDYTHWNGNDLDYLVGATGFNLRWPGDFQDERVLLRLRNCFDLLKRLGMSPKQCRDLAEGDVTAEEARGVVQAVQAKYDEADWLNVAKPLRDVLREKQRAALVVYLAAHPDPTKDQHWKNANDLYAHFLIDVEMSPCMMTSRIKQAIGSTQLFVQRCLMNLEPQVAANAAADPKWLEWKWMKNYRVWEANRKVFLYPENWIEPELRDDKSPLFKDLEGELLQSDLTLETAETAFRNYLEKFDRVARLDIVGMYHQQEVVPGGDVAVDILHVFGRTKVGPHVYYYRQRVNSAYWTAWEQVDLDIQGDHLIPVVWKRRLYLIWPTFTEKASRFDLTVPSLVPGTLVPGPLTDWEVKLAWSEHKQGKWTNKLVSNRSFLLIPRIAPLSSETSMFFFRSVIDADNKLTLLILSSDVIHHAVGPMGIVGLRFDDCSGDARLGDVTLTLGAPLTGTDVDRMFLKEVIEPDDGGTALFLPAPADTVTLKKTPGTFRLLPPHNGASIARHPFFYQDDTREFFVVPTEAQRPPALMSASQIDPATFSSFGNNYLSKSFSSDATQWSVNSADLPFQFTFPISQDPGNLFTSINNWPVNTVNTTYRFQTFYHPYVSAFVHELNRDGVDGMLQRLVQTDPARFLPQAPSGPPPRPLDFVRAYEPRQPIVDRLYPKEDVDFEYDGAYSLYNWELFFHAPLMIADRLSQNQRFEEAQKWFHYIFDPTDTSDGLAPQRYWHTKKFFETTRENYDAQRIQQILRSMAAASDPALLAGMGSEERNDLVNYQNAVKEWRAHPFKPHVIARLRTTAYQKTVVMKYIDNLIAWGDQLFRRDTIESINEATQLYILAADILGRRPESIPPRAIPRIQTYNSLESKLDKFSDALIQIEEFVSPSGGSGVIDPGTHTPVTLPAMMYFCVPKNDKLLGYWDTVGDRLFKIRHCRNIEGVERELPLFEPPIDPGLLVRAAAAGVDLSSAVSDTNVALPYYRFNVLAQKASELCADLKSLGSALLSALEKRDAEELTLIRAGHETSLLERVGQVKEKQLAEAEQSLLALQKSRESAVTRYSHYQKLLGVESGTLTEGQAIDEQPDSPLAKTLDKDGVKMIDNEKAEMDTLAEAHTSQLWAEELDRHANIAHLFPNAHIQPWGLGLTFGGQFIGTALSSFASRFRTHAGELTYQASLSAKKGQFVLRQHDWTLQNNLAAREIMQIDQQILAAQIRIKIATKELENHSHQVNNAREVEAYMRAKYTNQELYAWMVGQVAGVYFQSYQLAFDVAKRAERSYRHELGLKDSSFIQFGYWDNLKKGLMAGENLYHDLKRMEVAYLDQNKREYEITKHISLAQLDPISLLRLKQTGECFVSISEALFDIDFAGHYMRRIKAVNLTIPCVTGPYTGINCTLTLLKSAVRHSSALPGDRYGRPANEQDSRFTESFGAIQSIVTSSGQNDSGLFEQNLHDERYLPFEGNGAISEWRIELPTQFRQFDYDTISDVILHMRYTARDGGATLKHHAATELQHAIEARELEDERHGRFRLFSVRHEFPTEWQRFQQPGDSTTPQVLHLDITSERFPLQTKYLDISITRIDVFVKLQNGETIPDNLEVHLGRAATPASSTPSNTFTRNEGPMTGPQLWHVEIPLAVGEAPVNPSSRWTLAFQITGTATEYRFPQGTPEDILIVCSYTTCRSGSG